MFQSFLSWCTLIRVFIKQSFNDLLNIFIMLITIPDGLIKVEFLIHERPVLLLIRTLSWNLEWEVKSTKDVVHHYSSRILIQFSIVLAKEDLWSSEFKSRHPLDDNLAFIRNTNGIIERHEHQVNVLLLIGIYQIRCKTDLSVHNQLRVNVVDGREQLSHQGHAHAFSQKLLIVLKPLLKKASSAVFFYNVGSILIHEYFYDLRDIWMV